jgi:hypothetical protein
LAVANPRCAHDYAQRLSNPTAATDHTPNVARSDIEGETRRVAGLGGLHSYLLRVLDQALSYVGEHRPGPPDVHVIVGTPDLGGVVKFG